MKASFTSKLQKNVIFQRNFYQSVATASPFACLKTSADWVITHWQSRRQHSFGISETADPRGVLETEGRIAFKADVREHAPPPAFPVQLLL